MPEREINERFVKFRSKSGPILPNLIKPGEDVKVTINGWPMTFAVVKREYDDQQDGSDNEIFVLKFLS